MSVYLIKKRLILWELAWILGSGLGQEYVKDSESAWGSRPCECSDRVQHPSCRKNTPSETIYEEQDSMTWNKLLHDSGHDGNSETKHNRKYAPVQIREKINK